MCSISKKIVFSPLAGSARGVIGNNFKRFSQWYGKVFCPKRIDLPKPLKEGSYPEGIDLPKPLKEGSYPEGIDLPKPLKEGSNTFLSHKICICTGLLFILIPLICSAQQNEKSLPQELKVNPIHKPVLFQGRINAHNINVRSDSTVNSKIICAVNKGEPVEVVRESYEWYKIILPKAAPSFIKKDLVALIDEKTAKVLKDNVNIRLQPNESSAILGKAGKNEVINIAEDNGEWYKIEPLNNSFGWVNKKFVDKADTINPVRDTISFSRLPLVSKGVNKTEEVKLVQENKIVGEKVSLDESITIEGIIKPYGKVIKRIATHKLIAADNKVFLLKGNKESLDSLNYHKVKVTGKLIHPKNQKGTIIEILKIEALD